MAKINKGLFSRNWWLMALATLTVMALTASLGMWQWGRAATKEGLYQAQLAQSQLPTITGLALLEPQTDISQLQQRTVNIQGEWLAQHTVYLDNRSMGGQAGFWVLTPLQVASGKVVLVQRGWVRRDAASSTVLPAVLTPTGLVSVQGRLVAPPSQMVDLSSWLGKGNPATTEKNGALMQNIQVEWLAAQTGLNILANVLQQGPPSENLLRNWAPISSGADKNRAYAVQWFALSLLALGLFVWFQIVVVLRRESNPS